MNKWYHLPSEKQKLTFVTNRVMKWKKKSQRGIYRGGPRGQARFLLRMTKKTLSANGKKRSLTDCTFKAALEPKKKPTNQGENPMRTVWHAVQKKWAREKADRWSCRDGFSAKVKNTLYFATRVLNGKKCISNHLPKIFWMGTGDKKNSQHERATQPWKGCAKNSIITRLISIAKKEITNPPNFELRWCWKLESHYALQWDLSAKFQGISRGSDEGKKGEMNLLGATASQRSGLPAESK